MFKCAVDLLKGFHVTTQCWTLLSLSYQFSNNCTPFNRDRSYLYFDSCHKDWRNVNKALKRCLHRNIIVRLDCFYEFKLHGDAGRWSKREVGKSYHIWLAGVKINGGLEKYIEISNNSTISNIYNFFLKSWLWRGWNNNLQVRRGSIDQWSGGWLFKTPVA